MRVTQIVESDRRDEVRFSPELLSDLGGFCISGRNDGAKDARHEVRSLDERPIWGRAGIRCQFRAN